jgi:LmbE family N-acetylglucosaminyl deacetylase
VTRTLLGVFAHPDDESFSIGATLARLHAEGARTALYVATDGAAGRASGVELRDRADLARMRRAEMLRAAAVLGVGRVTMPGWPDGELGAQDQSDVVAGIVRIMRLVRPDVVVTFGPEGGPNQHRDHMAVSRATAAAYAAAPIDGWRPARLLHIAWSGRVAEHFGVAGPPVVCRLNVAKWMEAKRRAFDEHRTQWDLRPRFEVTVSDVEEFGLAAGSPCADDDLFGE